MAETVVMNPYGKYLEGEDVEVEVAQFAAKNTDGLYDVLLKMRGAAAFNAGIDGKTIKYRAVPGGSGVDYQVNGKTRMTMRQNNGASYFQVFLDGRGISIAEVKARSQEVRPLHLLTASTESGK
ncbi:hypothetical protein ACO0LF_19915 [Undibacterium sp. Di27W]|uniref:hypothetical protein n=1 Tax=Undibacterium sp. Di27W TaxID=3413036 RepID=UPI003BF1BFC6